MMRKPVRIFTVVSIIIIIIVLNTASFVKLQKVGIPSRSRLLPFKKYL